MPSGRAKRQPEPEPLVFFLDRGLGRHIIADALRNAGHHVLTMTDVYTGGTDMSIENPTWIARAGEEGWVALTKDLAIVLDHPDHLGASELRVFAFNNANLSGPVMAERLMQHLNRILQALSQARTVRLRNCGRRVRASLATQPERQRRELTDLGPHRVAIASAVWCAWRRRPAR